MGAINLKPKVRAASTGNPSGISQHYATRLDYEDEYAVFEQTLYALCKANRDREAIAEALDYFDDRLIAGRFRDCDRALRRLQVGKLASSVLVSILGITIRAKELKNRACFFERAFQEIAQQKGKKYATELLAKYGEETFAKFDKWYTKLEKIEELKDGWDSYTAPKPSRAAICAAHLYLDTLRLLHWEPARVEASAMGGVGITHRQSPRKVYVEFYNNGTVHALFSDRADRIPKMETNPVAADVSSYYRFIRKAREYLNG